MQKVLETSAKISKYLHLQIIINYKITKLSQNAKTKKTITNGKNVITIIIEFVRDLYYLVRGITTTRVTSKIELFIVVVNGFQPLANVTKNPVLDVAGSYIHIYTCIYYMMLVPPLNR